MFHCARERWPTLFLTAARLQRTELSTQAWHRMVLVELGLAKANQPSPVHIANSNLSS